MRAAIVFAALSLAACSEAPVPPAPSAEDLAFQEKYIERYMQFGMTREEAERKVADPTGDLTPAERARYAKARQDRQEGVAEIRASACRQDPGLSYC